MKTGRRRTTLAAAGLGVAGFFAVLVWSGIEAFQRDADAVPLAATQDRAVPDRLSARPAPSGDIKIIAPRYEEVRVPTTAKPIGEAAAKRTASPAYRAAPADGVKRDRVGKVIMVNGKPWTGPVFDHKPIRPVKTMTMKTTAYSPDHRSCGKWADGITASGKSVWMNGGRLVAADRKIPYGTILTIPGYNAGRPVQVWDRGGAIKGNRLDLLYPTHKIALRWGVQNKQVVFWEYVKTD